MGSPPFDDQDLKKLSDDISKTTITTIFLVVSLFIFYIYFY